MGPGRLVSMLVGALLVAIAVLFSVSGSPAALYETVSSTGTGTLDGSATSPNSSNTTTSTDPETTVDRTTETIVPSQTTEPISNDPIVEAPTTVAEEDPSAASEEDVIGQESTDEEKENVDNAPDTPLPGEIRILSRRAVVPNGGLVSGPAMIWVRTPAVKNVYLQLTEVSSGRNPKVAMVPFDATRTLWRYEWAPVQDGKYRLVAFGTDGTRDERLAEMAVLVGLSASPSAVLESGNDVGSADGTQVKKNAITSLVASSDTPDAKERERLSSDASSTASVRSENDSAFDTISRERAPNTATSGSALVRAPRIQVYEPCTAADTREKCRALFAARSGETRDALVSRIIDRRITDTDGDGVTDFDEQFIYGTDPREADTDGDQVSDGEEIRLQKNPVKSGRGQEEASAVPLDAVAFEDPRDGERGSPDIVRPLNIERVTSPSVEGATSIRLRIRGSAPPFAYVTVYVFSSPLVVTIQAGPDGVWQFELEEELEDGSHEVYAALTDGAGAIVTKSPALPFVQTAEAVSVGAFLAEPLVVSTPSPAERFVSNSFMVFTVGALLVAGFFVGLLGVLQSRRREVVPDAASHADHDSSLPPPPVS